MPKSKSKRKQFQRQPPPKPKPKRSPVWLGPLFFTLMGLGVAVIITYYVFLQGDPAWALWAGLGLISLSFVVATQWH
jgi:hypothetical protein